MRRQIESAVPPFSELRSQVAQFEDEARGASGERILIEFDLADGDASVSADPRELDELFESLVVNVDVVMRHDGRLTVHLSPDGLENMPDETELADASRWMHLAIEDHGRHPVGALFRRLLDPLINVAPQLAGRGALRWGGKILFEEKEAESRVLHLLLPWAGEPDRGH